MPALATPQQPSQSASESSPRRVVPKVRVSCWRRAGPVSPGTRMVTSTSALAMSSPATRAANSGSSCTSCINSPYHERAENRSGRPQEPGASGNLVRRLEAPLSAPGASLPAPHCSTGPRPPAPRSPGPPPRPEIEGPHAALLPWNPRTTLEQPPGGALLDFDGADVALRVEPVQPGQVAQSVRTAPGMQRVAEVVIAGVAVADDGAGVSGQDLAAVDSFAGAAAPVQGRPDPHAA